MTGRFGALLAFSLTLCWLGVAVAPISSYAEDFKLNQPVMAPGTAAGAISGPSGPSSPQPGSSQQGPNGPPSPCPYPSVLTQVEGPGIAGIRGTYCVIPGPIQGCVSGTQPTGVANSNQGEIACCPAGSINTPGNQANTSTDANWCCPAAQQGAISIGVSNGQSGYPYGGLPAGTCVEQVSCKGGPGDHNLCPIANGTATVANLVVCPSGF